MYYQVKVRLVVTTDKGEKKITENYLVSAEDVTEAKSIVDVDLANDGLDYEVLAVSQSNIVKVIKKKLS